MDQDGDNISNKSIASGGGNTKREEKSKVIFPYFGAGMAAVSTVTLAVSLALPYWIQFNETFLSSENNIDTDVTIKFTHGLWRYCNLVTARGQSTEKCGTIQSYSDSDLATQSMVVLSVLMSLSTVVHLVLYLSKLRQMSGQTVCLYIASISAVISDLLLITGLVIYGMANHDIKITNTVILEFTTSKLYICYWLAAAGCLTTTVSVIFTLLTLFKEDKSYKKKGTVSVASSKSSLKGFDNVAFTKTFIDIPQSSSSSASDESSDDEDLQRDPHPYIPQSPIKQASEQNVTTGRDDEKEKDDAPEEDDKQYGEESSESETDEAIKEKSEMEGKVDKEPLTVEIPDEEIKRQDYERVALSPETLTDIDDESRADDTEFYESNKGEITKDIMGVSESFQTKTERAKSEEALTSDPLSDTELEAAENDEHQSEDEKILVEIKSSKDLKLLEKCLEEKPDDSGGSEPHGLDEETEEMPSEDSNDEYDDILGGDADQDNISLKLDNTEETKEYFDQVVSQDKQSKTSFQQTGAPILSTNALASRELSNLSMSSQSNAASKYITLPDDHEQSSGEPGEEEDDTDYPLSFEDRYASAKAPVDTQEKVDSKLHAAKPKVLSLPKPLPVVSKASKSRKRPRVFKPPHKYHDFDRAKTIYDKPVWSIPQYPEVPFYKTKRQQGSPKASPKRKRKRNAPPFKDTILPFKHSFKDQPPTRDSEC